MHCSCVVNPADSTTPPLCRSAPQPPAAPRDRPPLCACACGLGFARALACRPRRRPPVRARPTPACLALGLTRQEQIRRFVARISGIQRLSRGKSIEHGKYALQIPVFNGSVIEYGKYEPRNSIFPPGTPRAPQSTPDSEPTAPRHLPVPQPNEFASNPCRLRVGKKRSAVGTVQVPRESRASRRTLHQHGAGGCTVRLRRYAARHE